MRNFLVFVLALVLPTLAATASPQLTMEAQVFQSADGESSVLLVDMVHFGPEAYYQNLAAELGQYLKARSNVVVLLEGINCRRDQLVLRDHLRRWPFPQLADLQKKFSTEELSAARLGQMNPALLTYFRDTLAQNLSQRGLDFYFARQPCAGAEQQAMRTAPPSQATQMQTIDDFYAQTAARVGLETGLSSITQHDKNNPLWKTIFQFADRGAIGAIVQSDLDRSRADPRDLDQLIWLARMGIQESNPTMVNGAFDYLSGVWYRINQEGFRNQIVIDALKVGKLRGHRHFVLPWGEAHNKDLAQRLGQMGYTLSQKTAVPYAPCSYVKKVVGDDRCKMGL